MFIGFLTFVLIASKNEVSDNAVLTGEKTEVPDNFDVTEEKIRECPDAWIDNRIPGVLEGVKEKRQYFIFDGERKEIDYYDLEWIKENCDIEPQVVY